MRGYRKVKRADDELRTRARIVDAAESLHGTLGPARVSVSAVADAAGVTRATVYRHFPDEEALFLACSSQWLSRQRLPDPDGWEVPGDPWASMRSGLLDLYRYYRSGREMLTLVERDVDVVPPRIRDARLALEQAWRDALLRPLPGRRRIGVRAAVGHASAFGTWRSLCVDQGLSDDDAAQLMVAMTEAAVGR